MNVLIKDYATMEDFLKDRQHMAESGGIMVESQVKLENRQKVELALRLVGGQSVKLLGEVVYVSELKNGFQVGLELKGQWREDLDKFDTEKGKIWGKDSESLFHRIQSMTMTEKVHLAVRCGKEERRILMKSAHHQTHIYLLKNPKITTDEVAKMSRSLNITTDMLIDISNNIDWMKQGSIKMAILKNPKTPLSVVKKHIHTLRDQDLYVLARSEHIRENVSRLAKSVLSSKGKRID
ncbi:MAG: hypothetical protein KDD48_07655 [Bdellovibrionales bacterium]|nr:hypothetical protein [Bdellovibrionales bacterium]